MNTKEKAEYVVLNHVRRCIPNPCVEVAQAYLDLMEAVDKHTEIFGGTIYEVKDSTQ